MYCAPAGLHNEGLRKKLNLVHWLYSIALLSDTGGTHSRKMKVDNKAAIQPVAVLALRPV